MPFIITTSHAMLPGTTGMPVGGGDTRIAVATLGDAAEYIDGTLPEEIGAPKVCIAIAKQIVALDEAGGTVGPLPDGTTIEVEPVLWSSLCGALGRGGISQDPTIWQPEIIDGYNAEIIGAARA